MVRALSLPEVASLRPGLVPEFAVYAATDAGAHEEAAAGIVDAIAFGADGKPEVVIDWKSDVAPSPETVAHYRAQVCTYLEMTGAARGLVVFVTSGAVDPVARKDGSSGQKAISARTSAQIQLRESRAVRTDE